MKKATKGIRFTTEHHGAAAVLLGGAQRQIIAITPTRAPAAVHR